MVIAQNGCVCSQAVEIHLVQLMQNPLKHPLTSDLNLDSSEATEIHAQIIREKPFLHKIYNEWCKKITFLLPNNPDGIILELGSGGGFLETFIPGLITSEIMPNPNVQLRTDARALPFPASSTKAIIMIDVFHHIPDVEEFLYECVRCLQPGGRIIMIEPWITKWSALIYNKLHHEPYLPETDNWEFPNTGPLSAANLALPWIVFSRDRDKFTTTFPELNVHDIQPDWPFVYLLSGGVSMRSLAPGCSYSFIRKLESLLKPAMNHIAMFATIVVEKK